MGCIGVNPRLISRSLVFLEQSFDLVVEHCIGALVRRRVRKAQQECTNLANAHPGSDIRSVKPNSQWLCLRGMMPYAVALNTASTEFKALSFLRAP